MKTSLLYVDAIFWPLDEKSLEILMYCDIWGFLNSVSKLHNIALLRIIHQSRDNPRDQQLSIEPSLDH